MNHLRIDNPYWVYKGQNQNFVCYAGVPAKILGVLSNSPSFSENVAQRWPNLEPRPKTSLLLFFISFFFISSPKSLHNL